MLKCVLKIIVVLIFFTTVETISIPPSDEEASEATRPFLPVQNSNRPEESIPAIELDNVYPECTPSAGSGKTKTSPSAKKKRKASSQNVSASSVADTSASRGIKAPRTHPEKSSSSASGKYSGKKEFYNKFARIINSSPEPIIPMQGITVKDEEAEGSRRFVKQFKGLESSTSGEWHGNCVKWHEKSLKSIECMRKALLSHGMPDKLNIALARINFFTELGGKVESSEFEWPHFFLSGWPSYANKLTGFPKLSKALSDGKVKELDKSYTGYSLQTITMEFQKGKPQDRKPADFFGGLQEIFSSEKDNPDKLIGEGRLKHHLKLAQKNDISALLYFHSEQSMRQCIVDKIKAKQDQEKKKEKSKVTSHFSAKSPAPKQNIYAIVDIASRYDMCWCCGDTLCSQSHTDGFDMPCYFQVSGGTGFPDSPFVVKSPLRDNKSGFDSYKDSISFTKDPFKPFMAHMANTDFSKAAEGVSA